MFNKKGYSSGFTWIIGLMLLLILGIGYIVLNQVMIIHIEPIADNLINSSPYLNASEISDLQGGNNKYISFWNSVPFIFVFLVIIWVVLAGIRGGDNERY